MLSASLQALLSALLWSAPRLQGRGKQRRQWGKPIELAGLCCVRAELVTERRQARGGTHDFPLVTTASQARRAPRAEGRENDLRSVP